MFRRPPVMTLPEAIAVLRKAKGSDFTKAWPWTVGLGLTFLLELALLVWCAF